MTRKERGAVIAAIFFLLMMIVRRGILLCFFIHAFTTVKCAARDAGQDQYVD